MSMETIFSIESAFNKYEHREEGVYTICDFYKSIQSSDHVNDNVLQNYIHFYRAILANSKNNCGFKIEFQEMRRIIEASHNSRPTLLRNQTLAIIEDNGLDKIHDYKEYMDYADLFLTIPNSEFLDLTLNEFLRKKAFYIKYKKKETWILYKVGAGSAFAGAIATFILTYVIWKITGK